MKRINWKALSPTYPKYGEHYRIWEKIAIWFSLIAMILSTITIIRYYGDEKMMLISVCVAYLGLFTFYSVFSSALTRRIKELQAQPSATTQKEGK
jgi:lipopolysaccharide export LptBFGC system permease protein LptF